MDALFTNTRYLFDASYGRFTVQAFASGILGGFAHSPTFMIRDFSGEMQAASQDFSDAVFRLTVRSASLELADKLKEKDRQEIQDLMSRTVLETEKYPEISFTSTKVTSTRIADCWYRLQIRGDMRLHGMVKSEEIDCQLRVMDDGPRLGGTFLLSQTAYRIRLASGMGGMIKVKDELKFVFDIIGKPPEQAP